MIIIIFFYNNCEADYQECLTKQNHLFVMLDDYNNFFLVECP